MRPINMAINPPVDATKTPRASCRSLTTSCSPRASASAGGSPMTPSVERADAGDPHLDLSKNLIGAGDPAAVRRPGQGRQARRAAPAPRHRRAHQQHRGPRRAAHRAAPPGRGRGQRRSSTARTPPGRGEVLSTASTRSPRTRSARRVGPARTASRSRPWSTSASVVPTWAR